MEIMFVIHHLLKKLCAIFSFISIMNVVLVEKCIGYFKRMLIQIIDTPE